MKATHEITACYFPGKGEVDLTWRNIESGERAYLTTKVPEALGGRIASVVPPCVYSGAIPPRTVEWYQERLEEAVSALQELHHKLNDPTVSRNTSLGVIDAAIMNARGIE